MKQDIGLLGSAFAIICLPERPSDYTLCFSTDDANSKLYKSLFHLPNIGIPGNKGFVVLRPLQIEFFRNLLG